MYGPNAQGLGAAPPDGEDTDSVALLLEKEGNGGLSMGLDG